MRDAAGISQRRLFLSACQDRRRLAGLGKTASRRDAGDPGMDRRDRRRLAGSVKKRAGETPAIPGWTVGIAGVSPAR